MNKQKQSYLWLVLGSASLAFLGWRWNVPIAAWLAPVFLIRFFRSHERWPATLIAIPAMTLGLFVNLTGSWDFTPVQEIAVSLARAIPLLVALYADRYAVRRFKPLAASLVFPAVTVVLDYLIAFSPLGTVFSLAATQFSLTPFVQIAAVTGIWGITFFIGWFASVANLIWDHGFNLKAAGTPAILMLGTLVITLFAGGARLSISEPGSETVRVAGITVEQDRDYWAEVIDRGTPKDVAHQYAAEFATLNTRLFDESERAAAYGAQIIFWSEANAMLYPEDVAAFTEQAKAFAQEHHVYFSPAYVVFRYDEATADNRLMMITPEGDIAYEYTKTKSWYPTDSDGILHSVETPYGTLSSAICFDMDFPAFVHQAAKQDVDIMLVPAFDWEPIKPYHTQVGLFRGIENGFSVVRQVADGTSMAVDYHGNVIAYQDFFDTTDPVMFADVPVQGTTTLYGLLGDWFAYLNMLYVGALIVRVLVPSLITARQPVVAPVPGRQGA